MMFNNPAKEKPFYVCIKISSSIDELRKIKNSSNGIKRDINKIS